MQLTNLNSKLIGKNFKYYNTIDSTQNEIWRLIKEDKIINGMLVMAGIQTNGKGTHGRIWHTDEEHNIAFSFYIETKCNIKILEGITIKIAKILVEIFKDLYGIDLEIKYPNDIICNGKKLGGILTESKVIGEEVKFMVIGIGINTNKTNFTEDIKEIATSIKNEFGIEINENKIVSEFCTRFETMLYKILG